MPGRYERLPSGTQVRASSALQATFFMHSRRWVMSGEPSSRGPPPPPLPSNRRPSHALLQKTSAKGPSDPCGASALVLTGDSPCWVVSDAREIVGMVRCLCQEWRHSQHGLPNGPGACLDILSPCVVCINFSLPFNVCGVHTCGGLPTRRSQSGRLTKA